jgi:hypothetical protein
MVVLMIIVGILEIKVGGLNNYDICKIGVVILGFTLLYAPLF